jgi:hypothetical protein
MRPDITITGANEVITKLSRQLVKNETSNPPVTEHNADETNPN